MGSKGSGATTTTENSSQSWMADPAAREAYLRLMGRAENVASTPYEAYTGQMVAGFTPFQQQAFGQTQAAQGMYQPYIQQGFGAAQQALTPSHQNVNAYMSPYIKNVVDATQASFSESNAQQQQQTVGNAALKGALGGDRVGVAQAELARQQKLAQDPVIANLYNQGYTSALGAAQNDANRALSAGGLYGSLAQTGQAMNYGDIGALYGMGSQQQQLEQAQLNVPYQQFLERRAFPYQQAQWLAGMMTGVGSQLGGSSTGQSTSTTTPPRPSPWSSLFGLGLGALSFFNQGGRIPRADGGIAVPYGGGFIPAVNLTPRPMQPPQLPRAKAPPAAPADNSAAGLVKQATDLAGGIRDSLRARPLSLGAAGASFEPTPVGQIAPSTFGADGGLGPLYAHGGKVASAGADARGIYLPRRGYQDGGTTFLDEWNDRVFEPSQESKWRPSDNAPGLGAALRRSAEDGPLQMAGAGDDIPLPRPRNVSADPGTGSIVPMAYAEDEPKSSVFPAVLGGSGVGGKGRVAVPAAPEAQNRGGGLFNLSDEARQALLAAGLGMMASKSPYIGQAIGEGGLAGVGVYREAMKLKEAAERARANLAETGRHNRATEDINRMHYKDSVEQRREAVEQRREAAKERAEDFRNTWKDRIDERRAAAGGVWQAKYDTYLRNHEGDTIGAENYANGRKQITDAEMLKWARRDANAEVKSMLVPPRDAAAATDKRTRELYEQYRRANSTGSAQGVAAPPAAAHAPTVPSAPNAAAPPAALPAANPNQDAVIAKAREAIAKGAPRDLVIKRLQENGYDASGL